MISPVLVRAGIPLPGGALIEHARARGMPILMSANAFARRAPAGHPRAGAFKGFRANLAALEGLDVALDSAGYVAAAHYGDFPWELEQYVDLAAARDWTWWSHADYCMEPEIASDAAMRQLRLAATAVNYGRCLRLARRRGIKDPTPVIQGWEIHEYLQCIEMMPILEWPELVGVGSMCRRPVEGPNGVVAIVKALDQVLPAHCRLHLFGVKSTALPHVARSFTNDGRPPRVFSVDSMAWDAAARADVRTGRTMDIRIGYLERWLQRQVEQQRMRVESPWFTDLPLDLQRALSTVRDIVGERLSNDILEGALEYSQAKRMLDRSTCWARAFAHQNGLRAIEDRAAIEEFLEENCL